MHQQIDLHSGDRMSRDEFLRRWERIPDIKRAELIDGVVYLASPVSELHSDYEQLFNLWLSHYQERTEGLKVMPAATMLIAGSSPQPDLALIRLAGSSRSGRKFREGPPELVVEITYSSLAYDLGSKLELYRRAGVAEYITVLLEERKVQWRVLENGRYHGLRLSGGYLKSRIFPGLWLDPKAVFPPGIAGLRASVEAGLASLG